MRVRVPSGALASAKRDLKKRATVRGNKGIKGKKETMSKKTEEKERRIDENPTNAIEKAQNFIYENGKLISYVSIGIIVLVVVLFVAINAARKKSETEKIKAMTAIDRILPYYASQDFKTALLGDSSKTIRGEAVIGLIDICEEYGGSEPAKVAALYAGNCYLSLDKPKEAEEYFELASESESKTVLEGAYAGLGAVAEANGDAEKAIDYYEKAAALAPVKTGKQKYNFYAALLEEKAGDKEKAAELYKKIYRSNRFSEYANYAKLGLARLGIEIDL